MHVSPIAWTFIRQNYKLVLTGNFMLIVDVHIYQYYHPPNIFLGMFMYVFLSQWNFSSIFSPDFSKWWLMWNHWRSYGPEVQIRPRNLATEKLLIIIKRVARMGLQNWYNKMKMKGFGGTKSTNDIHGLFPSQISTLVCDFGIDFIKCIFCSASTSSRWFQSLAQLKPTQNDRCRLCLITLSSETLHHYIGRGFKWTLYLVLSSDQFQFYYISLWSISVDS